jgi:hypothetical protein
MSGYLPGTRNVLSSTYVDDFVDEKPVEKPDAELPADVFNKMKSDLAYVARLTPRLVIAINSAGVVMYVFGPEGVVWSDIAVSGSGLGGDPWVVDWSGTGVAAGAFAKVSGWGDSFATSDAFSSDEVHVYTFSTTLVASQRAFIVEVY